MKDHERIPALKTAIQGSIEHYGDGGVLEVSELYESLSQSPWTQDEIRNTFYDMLNHEIEWVDDWRVRLRKSLVSIKEATSSLREYLGGYGAKWVVCIGVQEPFNNIIVYTNDPYKLYIHKIPKEWEGYTVEHKHFGEFANMNKV